MKTAPQMQQMITHLLEAHGIALSDPAAFLWLALPGRAERLVIERIDGRYLSLALAHAAQTSNSSQDPQLFFATAAAGWTPIHLDGAEPVGDLTQFAEAWAQRLLVEGWLTRAEKLPEPPWVGDEEALWASVFDGDDDDHTQTEENQADEAGDLPF